MDFVDEFSGLDEIFAFNMIAECSLCYALKL